MLRRKMLVALGAGALAAPLFPFAQQQAKVWRVGFLSARRSPPLLDLDYYGAFPRRLKELGYVDGRNLHIEWRFADGDYQRLPGMASDLVRLKMDAIMALGPPCASAAQKATTTIPIVIVVSGDPVAAGFVKSLARPGGNVTGLSNLAGDMGAKHLEMLLAIAPGLSRVAVLVNPANPAHAQIVKTIQAAAQKAGIKTITLNAQTPAEIDSALAAAAREQAGAVIVGLDPLFIQQVHQIASAASSYRLPSIFPNREYAEAGGLMSYGQNQAEIYRRAAEYVEKIFKGAKPAELPVEQPTKLELLINRKTAKALGLAIPQSLLISADKIIE